MEEDNKPSAGCTVNGSLTIQSPSLQLLLAQLFKWLFSIKEKQWGRPSSWNNYFQITEAITVTGGSRGRQTAEHVQRAVWNKGHRGQCACLIRGGWQYMSSSLPALDCANKPGKKISTQTACMTLNSRCSRPERQEPTTCTAAHHTGNTSRNSLLLALFILCLFISEEFSLILDSREWCFFF